jgi:PE-PPE domain
VNYEHPGEVDRCREVASSPFYLRWHNSSGTIRIVLPVRNRRHTAARVARSVGTAVLTVIAAVVLGIASTISSAVQLLASTALIMTGTFTPTPDQQYIDMAMNQFVQPTRPDRYNPIVAVTTPEEAWPITGLLDYTFGESVRIGLQDLTDAIAAAPENQPVLVFGYSQSGVISTILKRELDEEFPVGTPDAPPIQFVIIGDLNRPDGGVMARFPGLYIPLVNFFFNGPEPTDTQFPTISIVRQYDGFGDWPLYPINFLADLNAVMGMLVVHTDYGAVSLDPNDPRFVPGTRVEKFGDTTYYTIPTHDLPVLFPLRLIGVPEQFIDTFEPVVRWGVELGYDRTTNPGQPTPARLIPIINPFKAIGDLIAAINEGIDNTLGTLGSPPPVTIPAPKAAATTSDAQQQASEPTPGSTEPTPQRDPETTSQAPTPETKPASESATEPVTNNAKEAERTSKPEPTKPSATEAASSTPESADAARPSATNPPKPKLRGPDGFFGPRVRDLLHRGHIKSTTEADTTEADTDEADTDQAKSGSAADKASDSADS